MSTINNTPVSQDEIKNLMSKPVWQMSGEEFCILTMYATSTAPSSPSNNPRNTAGRLSRLLRKHHLCHQESRDS